MVMLIGYFMHNKFARMKNALGNGAVVTSGLLVMRLAAFVTSVIVARVSGSETLGEYTLFLTVFILASEIPSAFDTAYLRTASDVNDDDHAAMYQAINFASKLAILLFVSTIFWLLSDVIATALDKPSSSRIVLIAVICGGLNSMYMLLAAIAQQRHNFRQVAILKPVFNIFVVMVIFYTAMSQHELNIEYIFSVYLATGFSLAFIAAVILVRKVIASRKVEIDVAPYLKSAFILLLSMSIAQIGNRLDVFFLSKSLDFEQLGIDGVALRLSIVISVFTATIQTIMMPKATAASRNLDAFKQYLRLSSFYGFIQVVCGVVLLFILNDLIVILFGHGFSDSVFPSGILIVQALVMSLGIPFQALIQCGNRPSIMIGISLVRVFVAIPMLMYFIPLYGVVGAATSVLITSFMLTLIIIALALRHKPTA
jgi:O-antigen/teichoic acid export membrane protein